MEMTCSQVTTFSVGARVFTRQKRLPVFIEADLARHLESGVINLYPDVEYQTMEGFGGALTESSAYLFSEMDARTRERALEAFFADSGNRLRFVRTHIDSCDFSLGEYQAVTDPLQDPDFATFSIERDQKYILPVLKEILEINRESGNAPLEVLLSPWSPPKQWKTPPEQPKNDSAVYGGRMAEEIDYDHPSRTHGGSLKKEYYPAWAAYLAKYVCAYLDEGIPVTMMTMQNESIAATPWDSCIWSAQDQKTFLKENLYPAFEKAGLADKVGIYIWDHNKERILEWSRTMLDEETQKMVSGIAFHWYSGDHFEAVQMTADFFPDKTLMLSECCGMLPAAKSEMPAVFGMQKTRTPERIEKEDAEAYAHDIIGNLNAGMNRWIDWNLCLDTKGGPRTVSGGCDASMIVDNGQFRTTLIYNYVGHFSRYILPGAVRIGLSRPDSRLEVCAFKNTDSSIVLVALNQSVDDVYDAIRMEGKVIHLEVPAGTISTLILDKQIMQEISSENEVTEK